MFAPDYSHLFALVVAYIQIGYDANRKTLPLIQCDVSVSDGRHKNSSSWFHLKLKWRDKINNKSVGCVGGNGARAVTSDMLSSSFFFLAAGDYSTDMFLHLPLLSHLVWASYNNMTYDDMIHLENCSENCIWHYTHTHTPPARIQKW